MMKYSFKVACNSHPQLWQQRPVCSSPAQLLQDDEGSRMCDTWVSTQGLHAAAGPGAEPRSDDTQSVLHLILSILTI